MNSYINLLCGEYSLKFKESIHNDTVSIHLVFATFRYLFVLHVPRFIYNAY